MADTRRLIPGLLGPARTPIPSRRQTARQWQTTPDSMVAWGWYVDGVKQQGIGLDAATEHAKDGEGFVWLGLKDPTDEDMASFVRSFDLHPLAIEDAVEGHTRSKLEQFDDTLFCVISTVAYVDHEAVTATSEIVSTGQIMAFVGENFILTVRRGENTPLRTLRHSLEAEPEDLAIGPAYVLYKVLDRVVDTYLQVVAAFDDDIDEVEEDIFSVHGTTGIDRVYNLKRELIEFKRAVVPLSLPLQALATRSYPVVPDEVRAYFREVADHHTDARESILSFDEVLSTILQAGLARVSVADNQDMRRLSAIVAILAVPTTLGAVYGMNFDNMPELHYRYGYYVVLVAMVVGMIAAYAYFRRRRWL
ncbi:magnesium/cobalt transporter CorA [Luteococcus sp. Sow4_B9]|uniref:magnesium/cobalt transporter CorA n=1 Tax=Luteococcus sp. Sow4_B9 TaxID=3438792 RepID=UPI003F9E80A9